MTLSFKDFNNSQRLIVVGFVTSFGKDHFLRNKNYSVSWTNFGLGRNAIFVRHMIGRMMIQENLTLDINNNIPGCIILNINMMLRIKIIKNCCFNKTFLLVYKSFFSFESKKICFKRISFCKVQMRFFRLGQN